MRVRFSPGITHWLLQHVGTLDSVLMLGLSDTGLSSSPRLAFCIIGRYIGQEEGQKKKHFRRRQTCLSLGTEQVTLLAISSKQHISSRSLVLAEVCPIDT